MYVKTSTNRDMYNWADYVVFGVFLLASLSIGSYHALCSRGKQTTDEFLLGGRELKVIPTVLSLLVSFQSAIMILGMVAEIYTRGIQMWPWIIVGATLAITIAERCFLPWIYPLKLVSVYEYLEIRFKSKVIRITGACIGILSGVVYMGVVIFAPSIAFSTATGFPVSLSIVIMTCVCTVYTAMGGMKAVIWTDVFMFGVMIAGILAILIKGCILVGGFDNVWIINKDEHRMQWVDLSLDPRRRHTAWSISLGIGIAWSYLYGLSQPSVQRYSSTKSRRDASLTLWLSIPAFVFCISIICMAGLTVVAYQTVVGCDPLESKLIDNDNQILPYFVMTVFKSVSGFTGLFLATLYSGALSSVSSTLAAVAAIMWNDILKSSLPIMSELKATVINRIIVVIFGCLSMGIAFLNVNFQGHVIQIVVTFAGSVEGPIFGLFLLGGLFRKAEWRKLEMEAMPLNKLHKVSKNPEEVEEEMPINSRSSRETH